jgi:hypothetical protein
MLDETSQTTSGGRGLVARAIGAAMLNIDVYEEVEADKSATRQAAVVVGVVAIAMAIGGANEGSHGILGGIISAFLGWLVWAAVTNFVGTRLFKGTADWGELLRTLGFAQSPNVLWVLAILPGIRGLLQIVLAIWTLLTGIVAIRQALDFDTGKAVLTALVGVAAMIGVAILVAIVLGISFGGMVGAH